MRQRFSFSTIYELPFGKGKPFVNSNHLGQAVLGGWQLTGIVTAQTGFTVYSNSELRSDQHRHHRVPQSHRDWHTEQPDRAGLV